MATSAGSVENRRFLRAFCRLGLAGFVHGLCAAVDEPRTLRPSRSSPAVPPADDDRGSHQVAPDHRQPAPPDDARVQRRRRAARPDGGCKAPKVSLETPNQTVRQGWAQAVRDMEALRLEDPTFGRGVYSPAAGVPWFVTVFGRDALIVSILGITGYPEFVAGALR